jgi:hypothetical protein
MRIPLPIVIGAALVVSVGAAGVIRGAQPLPAGNPGTPSSTPIVVSYAYVRAPAPPTNSAAAYFTVFNTTATPDRLQTVLSGAGAETVLHVETANGDMVVSAAGPVIPAHGSLVFKAGGGHVMIEGLYGTLKAGQSVSLELQFQNAGIVNVTAPVIALGAPAPTSGGGS